MQVEGDSGHRGVGSQPPVHRGVPVWCHACCKGFNSCWKNVCEMLIRHECCAVGAPGSGGGTPCATNQREMEALLSCKNQRLCARGLKTHKGARVRKQELLEVNKSSNI